MPLHAVVVSKLSCRERFWSQKQSSVRNLRALLKLLRNILFHFLLCSYISMNSIIICEIWYNCRKNVSGGAFVRVLCSLVFFLPTFTLLMLLYNISFTRPCYNKFIIKLMKHLQSCNRRFSHSERKTAFVGKQGLRQLKFMIFLSFRALKYGSLFKIWIGNKPWLIVSDPELVKEILLGNKFPKDPVYYSPISKLYGQRYVNYYNVLSSSTYY